MDSRSSLGLVVIGLLVTLIGSSALARTGDIQGTVYDLLSGERLVSANVRLVGTTMGAVADLTGSFLIHKVPVGSYSVSVSYLGYVTKVVYGVVVSDGTTTTLDIRLAPAALKTKGVEVSVERVRSTADALLAERQRSATVSDGISAEEISHSPDATSADALKRVAGLSVLEDKFVYIRGVTDRYNGTSLNGTSVTGTDTDVDKKSFCFDMLPANLLENAVVIKTATPDRPGDFTGGVVEVNTLDFPSKRMVSLSLSPGYNTATSTRAVAGSRAGKYDWLGFDDGERGFPKGNLAGYELAKTLPNNWTARTLKAPLNSSFSFSAGDRLALGTREVGAVVGLSYRRGRELVNFEQRPTYRGEPIFDYEGKRSTYSVLLGGVLGLNCRLSDSHKLRIDADFSQAGSDAVSKSSGTPISGQFTTRQTIEWDQRSFALVQLSGNHKMAVAGNTELDWKAFTSRSDAAQPDRKHVEYELGSSDVFYMKENYRTWSNLGEWSDGATVDLSVPVTQAKVKLGLAWETRNRKFDIKAFSTDVSSVSRANYNLLVLPLDTVFSPENYGPGKFNLVQITPFTGKYSADYRSLAYYAMVDQPFSFARLRWRVVWGARVENSDQQNHTVKALDDPTPYTAVIKKTDLLPSVNLTCALTSRSNIRLAYSRTLNRPEFREMANVLYYDFNRSQNVIGNPYLKRAQVTNYDARFEVFPGIGQTAAVSVFYKKIKDAIEEREIPSAERYVRTWFNSPHATNYGWEIDFRQSLGRISKKLQDLAISGNYTRVFSSIEYTEKRTAPNGAPVITQKHRTMQGQSPWTANLGATYAIARSGTGLSLMVNRIGRRIVVVGDTREEDVYEEPSTLVDFAFTQKLPGGFSAKLAGTNVTGHDEVRTCGTEQQMDSRYSNGRSYSLSLGVAL